jgi:hypothetical protein
VTIQNRAGQPLTDMKIKIDTMGVLSYSTMITRMETSEKRDLSLGSFRTNDGVSFDLRTSKPKQVVVTGTDLVGKAYKAIQPWKS